jgi:PAP2 superfamily
MTTIFKLNRHTLACWLIVAASAITLMASCRKETNKPSEEEKNASSYSSDVLDKWLTMQIRLMRNATGIPNQAFSRHYAYAGLTALESLSPGLDGSYKKWSSKWNGLSGLPVAGNKKDYYYPANANAALAAINRAMFPNANAADKAAIDSLETALKQQFLLTEPASIINNSEQFGKSVATAVFNWAETDGYKNANAPYTLPTGTGIWKPFPSTATPSTPYWGNNRTIITGSLSNTTVPGLPAYSANPESPFYQMVKQVYDSSLTLTDGQKAMALYWRDVPGVTSPGHWVSIVQQVLKEKNVKLDKAVLVYALTGIAVNDVLIRSFQVKYQHLTVRPVTYIREVMGHSNWSSFIGTPPHPEYISNHSSLSVAAGAVLEALFGRNQPFTDHTYDYMGMASRSYPSYMAIGLEAGLSRFYGGIHYIQSIDDGTELGKMVVENIFIN